MKLPARMKDRNATIEGFIEGIIFRNDENGYLVARLKDLDTSETFTVVGNMIEVSEHENVQLHGRWIDHERYGKQFKFESYRAVPPSSLTGIRRYLSSGLIKGVGKKTADRLVEHFGTNTLEVIHKDPERLREVEGLGVKRIREICESLREMRELQDAMIFFQSYGITVSQAKKILEEYGDKAITVIRANPYRLARDIFGIGFKTADKIAQNLGIPLSADARVDAGLVYVLDQFSEDGHVCFPRLRMLESAREILRVEMPLLESALERQLQRGALVKETRDEEYIYTARCHRAEVTVAELLAAMLSTAPSLPRVNFGKAFKKFQVEHDFEFAENQKHAIKMALNSKASIITGGPGVGKTTVIKALLEFLVRRQATVVLAAPTGRAAKRMAEATGQEARTIHRLLRFNPSLGRFEANENDPLKGDVFIFDESSMIDILLMSHLMRAIPPEAHIILVGDADQLPSVGPGNVLRDLIECKRIPVTHLDVIFRQASRSNIVRWAHEVNHGRVPELPPSTKELTDFYFVQIGKPENALEMILNLCTERIPKRFGLDPMKDVQVISPMHRGILGVTNLNEKLRLALNPPPPGSPPSGRDLNTGDKVMQIRNNYDLDVFNGDIGFVHHLAGKGEKAVINYDGRDVEYTLGQLSDVVPAYAISVHKSQGSEYPAIVLPLVTQHYVMLQRNLLYTAITRGRLLVVIVGTPQALRIAVETESVRSRYTGLRERLEDGAPDRSEVLFDADWD